MFRGAFAAISFVLMMFGCGVPQTEYFGDVDVSPDVTHLRYCNSGEPDNIDPAVLTDSTATDLSNAVFEGLGEYDLKGLPVPAAATHWDISPDAKKFTFYLRREAKWSNGRALNAHDFAYHIVRILHPLTASRNTTDHEKIKNGALFVRNRVRVLQKDVAPFRAGDVVEVIGRDNQAFYKTDKAGKVEKDAYGIPKVDDKKMGELPNPNKRASSNIMYMRDLGADPKDAYTVVPAQAEVTLIEFGGPNKSWAYIHYNAGMGTYGWVRKQVLDIEPHKAFSFRVRSVAKNQQPGLYLSVEESQQTKSQPRIEGTVSGGDLLMLPAAVGVKAVDDYTLTIEYADPNPSMVDGIAGRAFRATPRESVSRFPRTWTKDYLVHSGPFGVEEWKDRDFIRLKKSQTYWDKNNVYLERLTAFSMDDQAASANYYFYGGCDAVATNNVPSTYVPLLNGKKTGKAFADFSTAPMVGIYNYLINTEKYPNVHFRRALSHAIDRAPIPDITGSGEIPTDAWVPGTPITELTDKERALCGVTKDTPGVAVIVEADTLCYVPPRGPGFDVEAAKKEWNTAKQEMGDTFPTQLTLRFNSGNESHKLIAEYVQQQWQNNLGLKVFLESQEWKTFLDDTRYGRYEVARMGWIGGSYDPETNFVETLMCGDPNNKSRYCNEEFDNLLRQARSTGNRAERSKLVRQAEEIMINESPVIPLYIYKTKHLRKPYVKDLAQNPLDQINFKFAKIDKDWKKNKVETN